MANVTDHAGTLHALQIHLIDSFYFFVWFISNLLGEAYLTSP